MQWIEEHAADVILAIVLALVAAAIFTWFEIKRRERKDAQAKLKKYFDFTWKDSFKLTPSDFLPKDRNYHDYYLTRSKDNSLLEKLQQRQNVLIKGSPLSGKTRAAYQALTNFRFEVIKPACGNINREDFVLPKRKMPRIPGIMFLDDLQVFVEKENFEHLFRVADEKGIIVLATCRSGEEYLKVKNKMQSINIDIETKFEKDSIIELEKVPDDTARQVAATVGIIWKDVRFDGNIGSVFVRLAEMERRYNQDCGIKEKIILRVLRKLYISGIYEGRQAFLIKWIRTLTEKQSRVGEDNDWTEWLGKLTRLEFITLIDTDRIHADEVYLEDVVKPEFPVADISIFKEALDVFSGAPEALLLLGSKVYSSGLIKIEKAQYMKIALAAFGTASNSYDIKHSPFYYGMTQNNLGTAYSTLGEVEEKAANCKKAITAYHEALQVYTLESFPMDYGMTQNNLGTAYRTLGEVEEKAENCKKAIMAYQEALRVYNKQEYPQQYAGVSSNLKIVEDLYEGAE
jgi:tetratricopeptide (TPR) repeat protein